MTTTVAVVVPSYGRADELPSCLVGLSRQSRMPDDVLIVVRTGDQATSAVVDGFKHVLPIRAVAVDEPGLIRALNAGLAASGADIVAFTDDDAVPRKEWLARIEIAFQDTEVAAVGGRDVNWDAEGVVQDGPEVLAAKLKLVGRRAPVVGRVQRFGRITGNHHAGLGPARDTDILKGVNMAYRRRLLTAMGFDCRLRGTGSQVHNEPSVCLPLRAAGWRIVYDPAVTVDHRPAPRPHEDDRELRDPRRVYDRTFNEALSLWPYIDRQWRPLHIAWAIAIGTIWSPGLAQIPRHLRRGNRRPWRIVLAAARARRDAVLLLRSSPKRPKPPSPAQFVPTPRSDELINAS